MPGYTAFFVPAASENLLCRICHLPVRDAVQVLVCGHRFCDSCLNGALTGMRNGRLRCPVDSSSIDYANIYADDVTNQMIMSLSVYCDNYQAGCKWKGQLRKLQAHLRECKYVIVDCPNLCGRRTTRKKMDDHLRKECAKRKVTCSRCRREISRDQVQDHSCSGGSGGRGGPRSPDVVELVACTSRCGARVRREALTQHVRIDCPNRWVYCEYCHNEIVFKDKQEHLRRCDKYNQHQGGQVAVRGQRAVSVNTPSPSVRFEPRDVRPIRSSRELSSGSSPPLRSQSFPAFLNYIGREEFGSQVIYRGGSRGDLSEQRVLHGAVEEEESDTDIFTCSCGRRISRIQITSHMSDDCPKRLVKCQYCSAQVKFEDLQNHLQVCPLFPISCPNNCGVAQIPREQVDHHLANECRSNAVAHCPFKHAGCQHQCSPRGLVQHLQESMSKHLELVSELAIQQQKQINDLREIVKHCKPYRDSKLLWKITNFWEKFDDGKRKPGMELHSPPFYTGQYGYKFKVVVFPYGNGSGEGTHLSLYIRLLPGEHDALLKWPFEGEITLTLVDQSRDSRSKRNINQSFSPDPSWKSFQRPSKNSGALGFGYPQFVSHRGIESSGYVKENCLFIKAVIDGKYAIDL